MSIIIIIKGSAHPPSCQGSQDLARAASHCTASRIETPLAASAIQTVPSARIHIYIYPVPFFSCKAQALWVLLVSGSSEMHFKDASELAKLLVEKVPPDCLILLRTIHEFGHNIVCKLEVHEFGHNIVCKLEVQ